MAESPLFIGPNDVIDLYQQTDQPYSASEQADDPACTDHSQWRAAMACRRNEYVGSGISEVRDVQDAYELQQSTLPESATCGVTRQIAPQAEKGQN
jgi:hypothetical protein